MRLHVNAGLPRRSSFVGGRGRSSDFLTMFFSQSAQYLRWSELENSARGAIHECILCTAFKNSLARYVHKSSRLCTLLAESLLQPWHPVLSDCSVYPCAGGL